MIIDQLLAVLAEAAWFLMCAGAAVGFAALIDEVFPKFWPAVWRFSRRRYWRDRPRRHPIIKEWNE